MPYLTRLSRKQYVWLIGTLMVAISIVAIGWVLEPRGETLHPSACTTDSSVKQIAPKLGVTGKALARELGLPLEVPKMKPLRQLGIEQDKLDNAVAHLASHRPTQLKYYVFAALVLWAVVFLGRLGRPDGSPVSEHKQWYPRAPFVVTLIVAVVVCGFLLGKSPNPMEGAVKVFKSMVGLYPSVWEKVVAFLFFMVLAVVGNKLVCGWACPFGALQELAYSLPVLKRVKRQRMPFVVSNSIRAGLFVAMLLLLFGLIGGSRGFVLYHGINPFNLFDLQFETGMILATVVVSLGSALFVYRPFCQLICPFGFVSWLAERLSLMRVRVNCDECNKCGACENVCPSGAARYIVQGKTLGADCYSCARCLNVCPSDAIAYSLVFGEPKKQQ
jgi:ferredoxin